MYPTASGGRDVHPCTPAPAPAAPPAPPAPPPDLSRPARIDVSQCARPEYPAVAAREEATGTTRLRFKVDAAGRVVAAEVAHGVSLALPAAVVAVQQAALR